MTIGSDLRELEVPEHRAGFFDDLRDELAPRKARVTRPRLLLVAAAAAIIAGALAFSLTRGSEVATAAQVRAAVEHALASTGSISGVLVINQHEAGGLTARARFVLSSTGAFRLANLGTEGQEVYDPARNTRTDSTRSELTRTTGLAAGPPDAEPELFRGGLVVAALAEMQDSRVDNVTYDGHPAWLLRTSTGTPGEQVLITVDRATGLPLDQRLLRDGHLTSEVRIEHARVSATEARITQPVPAPGQRVQVTDLGFRRTSLADARNAAGYSPLVPKRLPHGFKLTHVVYASLSQPTNCCNPRSRHVISLSYRRGFEQITVTTRLTGHNPSAWKDPFLFSGATTGTSRVTFTGGALAGNGGYLYSEPDEIPHIWAVGPQLVVTVAGTVTRDDLLRVANSLTQR